jgi:glutathione S-transferase
VFEFLGLLDRELKDRMFIAGDHYTVADITALVAVDFMRPAKLIMPEEFANLRRWHAQVGERVSATA